MWNRKFCALFILFNLLAQVYFCTFNTLGTSRILHLDFTIWINLHFAYFHIALCSILHLAYFTSCIIVCSAWFSTLHNFALLILSWARFLTKCPDLKPSLSHSLTDKANASKNGQRTRCDNFSWSGFLYLPTVVANFTRLHQFHQTWTI